MKATTDSIIETIVEIQGEHLSQIIPVGTEGTIIECYENPEAYAVDIALPDPKNDGEFLYDNLYLYPKQFEVIKEVISVAGMQEVVSNQANWQI
jgi:hypothetical protein